jgi:hypothetical protein
MVCPRQNFYALSTPPSSSQVDIIVQENLHTIRASLPGYVSILRSIFRNSGSADETFEVERSSSCMLKNSSEWFEAICAERPTRRWIEKQILRSMENRIYLIVGFRSLWHRAIFSIDAQPRIPTNSSTVTSPADSNVNDRQGMAWENEDRRSRDPPSLPLSGELVYAVQYRRLVFKWFRRNDIDAARLQKGNCWQSLYLGRGDEGDDDQAEDYLQVNLDMIVDEVPTLNDDN